MDAIVSSFGLDWKIFLAEIVNFGIVLAIIYFLVIKKISPLLEKRRQTIIDGVEKSQKAEETLKAAEAEKADILKAANIEASDTIALSVERAKMREDTILKEAGTKGEVIIKAAERKGHQEKEAIIESSKDDIAKMVVLGVEKVLKGR